jgi:hypothetical protein
MHYPSIFYLLSILNSMSIKRQSRNNHRNIFKLNVSMREREKKKRERDRLGKLGVQASERSYMQAVRQKDRHTDRVY